MQFYAGHTLLQLESGGIVQRDARCGNSNDKYSLNLEKLTFLGHGPPCTWDKRWCLLGDLLWPSVNLMIVRICEHM
jgi:hypothetical protein